MRFPTRRAINRAPAKAEAQGGKPCIR